MLIVQTPPSGLAAPEPLPKVYNRGGTVVVRMPNHLGDAVMALPAIKQLRESFSRVAVIAATRPVIELLANVPDIDDILALARAHSRWRQNDRDALAAFNADCGILFNNSLRDAWNFWLSGVKNRYGASARWRAILLTEAFKLPRTSCGRLTGAHHARIYSALAESVGAAPWSGKFPKFNFSPASEPQPRLLAVAPGAAYGDAKRWPSSRFKSVIANYLDAYPDATAVILGSEAERAIGNEVIAGLAAERVQNLCGRTSISELATLLRTASACLANDSGIMHLAAALGAPGVAVFGSTDYTSTAPVSTRWKVIYSEMPCAPCFSRNCPKGYAPDCMNAIDEATVSTELIGLNTIGVPETEI